MAQRKGRERRLNEEEIGQRLNESDSDDDYALDLEMDGVDDEEEDDLGEQERVLNSRGEVLEVINLRYSGAYLGFCQGGCTFLADLPPFPQDLDPDPHQDFELDPDSDPSKQCGSTAQGSTVKRLLSNL